MYLKEVGNLKAKGAYSLAVLDGDTVYISGQLPVDLKTGELHLGTAEEETATILSNIEAILGAYGCGRDSIVKTTVFVTHPDYWSAVNKAYAEFFVGNPPARSCVAVNEIPYMGFKVEIEAVASIRKKKSAQ